MEYLSNERTLPETFAPFRRCTVRCFPPASATLRNDSWTLITDIIHPWPEGLPGLAGARKTYINDLKIVANRPYVQNIIGLSLIGFDYGSPSTAIFLRGLRDGEFYSRRRKGASGAALAIAADYEIGGRTGRASV